MRPSWTRPRPQLSWGRGQFFRPRGRGRAEDLTSLTTLCLKKVIFKLFVTLSNLNRFSQFLHCWKAYEIWDKVRTHCPPHLRHVATLPWEIKKSKNFADIQHIWKKVQTHCILIASNFVTHPRILIFSVF